MSVTDEIAVARFHPSWQGGRHARVPDGSERWIGSAVARELIDAGHSVVGLVRSKENGEALAAAGVTPLLGSLTDLDVLRQGAENADGIIHTAFRLDSSKYEKLSLEDRAAIETFGEVFAGSDRPIVVTSGLGLLPAGETFTENARPAVIPEYPRASEQTAFALAERGLRASVVRPARSVHGLGERHGFVPMLADIAREQGVSA
jgi:nucleoside-diphosphate-sugar epimerase